jgi:hypothetical protein
LAWLGSPTVTGLDVWPSPSPPLEITAEGTVVRVPGRYFVAEIGRFEDELFAYLMFDYFRSAKALKGTEVLLTYSREGRSIAYPLLLVMPDDLLVGIPMLVRLNSENWFPDFTWKVADKRARRDAEPDRDIRLTLAAYRKLEQLTRRSWSRTRGASSIQVSVDPRARKQQPLPGHWTTNKPNGGRHCDRG